MIYTQILNFFVGWFNRIDNLFFRLVLLPIAVILIVIGNSVAIPVGLLVFVYKKLGKLVVV